MRRPFFSIVIPTLGRPSISSTLKSIVEQNVDHEVIVVADTFENEISEEIKGIIDSYKVRYYEFDAGQHDTGSPQLHLGFQLAKGHVVLNFGDDDIYIPGALNYVEEIVMCDVTKPYMFRSIMFPNSSRGNKEPDLLWRKPILERYNITGQCFIAPNDKLKLGRWLDDVTFMRETVKLCGDLEWNPVVIAECY